MRDEYSGLSCAEGHTGMVRSADDAESEGALVLGQHNLLQKQQRVVGG